MSDKLEKAEKHGDGSNSNNHDVCAIGAKRRVNHNNRVERHVEVDFREDNDDFEEGGFEAETLGHRVSFQQPRN